ARRRDRSRRGRGGGGPGGARRTARLPPPPAGGTGAPEKKGDRHDQQEAHRSEEAERGEVQPAGRGEVDEPRGTAAGLRRAAQLERADQDPRQHQQDERGHHRPPAAQLADRLDPPWQGAPPGGTRGAGRAFCGGHGPASVASVPPGAPSISARNASSRRRLGPTRSTGIPAPTSAATTAEAGTPLGWTCTPSACRSTESIPASPRSTDTARSACRVAAPQGAPAAGKVPTRAAGGPPA